jgi:hypothetical protein
MVVAAILKACSDTNRKALNLPKHGRDYWIKIDTGALALLKIQDSRI